MNESGPSSPELCQVLENLGIHDHIALIYENRDEQFAGVIPAIRIGLERGEKCIYVADEVSADVILNSVRAAGIDVDGALKSGGLVVANKQQTYFRDGRFDPDEMIRFWREACRAATAGGFSGLRVLAEMTWALGSYPGVERLIEYEAKLNDFVRDCAAVIICQYSRTRFAPEIILNVIRTHPIVIYGKLVCRNPYFIPPLEFLAPHHAGKEVQRLLNNLLDRERSSMALRQSEERFTSFMRHLPGAAFIKDVDGRYVYVNETASAAQNAVGPSIGKTDEQIFPAETAAAFRLNDRRVIESGQTHQVIELAPINEEPREWLSTKFPIRASNGDIAFVGGIAIDITERRRTEEALRSSEERFRKYFELGVVGMSITTPEKGMIAVNDQICTILGYERCELLKMTWSKLTHPDDLPADVANFNRILSGASDGYSMEKRFIRKDGQVIDSTISVKCLRRPDGTIDCFLALLQDITERKRAQTAIARSREFYVTLMEMFPAPIWRSGLDAKCDYFNQTWLKFTGRTFQQELGDGWAEGIHPDDRARCLKNYLDAFHARVPFEMEYRLRRHDGEYRWIVDQGRPFLGLEGNFAGYIGACIDITERKNAQSELEASRGQLRALLAQLHRAREDERTRVAREVHDELGQLLTSLKIDLRWLEDQLSEPGIPPALNPLLDRAVAASELVDNTIATVQSIAAQLRPSALDQLGLYAALRQEVRRFQARTGIRCHVELPESSEIKGSDIATALFYICSEALTNVARHANATNVGIHLKMSAVAIELEVYDDGMGIADGAWTLPTSLGLLGMRERALMCGGTVTVEKYEPRGTRVAAHFSLGKV